MEPRTISQIASSRYPALELISLAQLAPEVARQSLRSLLLEDPNYFHNVTADSLKTVLRIQADSTYECVGHLGYRPHLRQLHACVDIRQLCGYSSGDVSCGSKEFVRFYLSCNGGEIWRDQGLCVIRVSDTNGPRSPQYAASVSVRRSEDLNLFQGAFMVRAILSWNTPPPPDSPVWLPIWGNREDAQIRMVPSRRACLNSNRQRTLVEDRREMIPAGQTFELRQVS